MRERERLIARIRQIRRSLPVTVKSPNDVTPDLDDSAIGALEARVEHLEQLVEALQDSVHRESERYDKRLAEIDARLQPSAISIALSRDARERGL